MSNDRRPSRRPSKPAISEERVGSVRDERR